MKFSPVFMFCYPEQYELGVYQMNAGDVVELPFSSFVLALLLAAMVAFYATSFDSIAMIASCYSYRELGPDKAPHKLVQLMWCILLILLPIGLVFSDSSMTNLQSVSIIAAFPTGIVIVLIAAGFLKDAGKFLKGQ